MKHKSHIILVALLWSSVYAQSQLHLSLNDPAGNFSLGTRNTVSLFGDDSGVGLGIGGQFRIQPTRRLNTEWFFDYITSKDRTYTIRNDYHIGWSVMFYPEKTPDFGQFLTPYLLIGHCFDYSRIASQKEPSTYADRTSMATQAGAGTHLNITEKLDCSISAQYMLHFGKEIDTEISSDEVIISKHGHSSPHGHLLLTMSFNYKITDLW